MLGSTSATPPFFPDEHLDGQLFLKNTRKESSERSVDECSVEWELRNLSVESIGVAVEDDNLLAKRDRDTYLKRLGIVEVCVMRQEVVRLTVGIFNFVLKEIVELFAEVA